MVFWTGQSPHNTKYDESQYGQAKYEYQETGGRYAQVVDTFANRWRPQWEETNNDSTDHQQRTK